MACGRPCGVRSRGKPATHAELMADIWTVVFEDTDEKGLHTCLQRTAHPPPPHPRPEPNNHITERQPTQEQMRAKDDVGLDGNVKQSQLY